MLNKNSFYSCIPLIFILTACGGESGSSSEPENSELPIEQSFDEKILGTWDSNCWQKTLQSIEFRSDNKLTINGRAFNDNNCTGEPFYHDNRTYSYNIGNIFITMDNKEARELTIESSEFGKEYNIIWIDENDVLYTGGNFVDYQSSVSTSLEYDFSLIRRTE